MKAKFTKPLKARHTSSDPLRYQQGLRNSRMELRDPAPEMVRGKADVLRKLVATARVKDCLTTGVLSFAEGMAQLSEIVQRDIMESFEKVITVGQPEGKVFFVWVRHTEHRRVELHFTIFRELIGDGRRFTPFLKKLDHLLFTRWQWLTNLKYELKAPEATVAQRWVKPCLGNSPEVAEAMNTALDAAQVQRLPLTRDAALELLAGLHYRVKPRVPGKRSVEVVTPENKTVRVSGPLFEPDFHPERWRQANQARVQRYHEIITRPHALEAEFLADLERRKQRQHKRYPGLVGASAVINAEQAGIRLPPEIVAKLQAVMPKTASSVAKKVKRKPSVPKPTSFAPPPTPRPLIRLPGFSLTNTPATTTGYPKPVLPMPTTAVEGTATPLMIVPAPAAKPTAAQPVLAAPTAAEKIAPFPMVVAPAAKPQPSAPAGEAAPATPPGQATPTTANPRALPAIPSLSVAPRSITKAPQTAHQKLASPVLNPGEKPPTPPVTGQPRPLPPGPPMPQSELPLKAKKFAALIQYAAEQERAEAARKKLLPASGTSGGNAPPPVPLKEPPPAGPSLADL